MNHHIQTRNSHHLALSSYSSSVSSTCRFRSRTSSATHSHFSTTQQHHNPPTATAANAETREMQPLSDLSQALQPLGLSHMVEQHILYPGQRRMQLVSALISRCVCCAVGVRAVLLLLCSTDLDKQYQGAESWAELTNHHHHQPTTTTTAGCWAARASTK